MPATTVPTGRRAPTTARRLATNARHVLAWAAILGLCLLLVRTFVLDKPLQLPLEPRAEMSDSMAPELRAGDLLFLKHRQADEVSVGDIVAFADPEGTGKTIIHRAVQITPASNGELEFVTRGDANGTSVERWRINRDGTVGVVAFDLPLLGRAAIWLQDLGGRTLLLLTSVLFMGLALVRIWRPDRSEPQA